jgi:chromosomal replication initiator protein
MNMNAWDQIKKELQSALTAESYDNWVSRTRFGRLDKDLLVVTVPDEATKNWMETEYSGEVSTIIRKLDLAVRNIEYSAGNNSHRELARVTDSAPSEMDPSCQQLSPKLTFDTFVVGACNQFAHAAARSVATHPSRSYNPLFIYGGTGMGKTHLLHAIGHALVAQHSSTRLLFTSSERFMNEMITCIRLERMSHFHQRYRSADVLLVDDIQLLGNKERTQEEFFHTFNELHDNQKQIVISSDCPPKDIPGLVERLRSRFEWGLLADMQPPDLETKMAILDKKAGMEGVSLPEDVRAFMASRTKSNVRELEGALVKLVAYSSVTGSPITLTMAQQVLKYLIPGQERRVTMDSVIRAVAERFQLQPAQLKQKTNARQISYPRQIAMYLIKELTHASLPEIGRVFGGKHHTTVLHSVQKIDRLRHNDSDLNQTIHNVMDSIH